jgi:serine/threonine protein kinase
LVGETIGSYRVLDQLGQGGMGTVYLAEHRHLHRKAAIKVLLKEFISRPDLLERFFAEARATSLIEHAGIVQIFDCEVDADGRPYIVMEFLGGETLAGHLRHGPLPAEQAAAYARCMAEALAAAHDKGIIHRDIKPDNVFVKPGPPPSAKLVDFGIAKLAGEFHAGLKNRTQTGIVMGTPLYMSPEQCRGAGTVDYRTDIYSLGCLLFEMLAGRPPYQYEGAGELVPPI